MAKVCKHCGCDLSVDNDTDECVNIGFCVLITARRAWASETDQLIADAVAAHSALDDARRARDAEPENEPEETLTGVDLFSREVRLSSALW